ncbi:MAG: HEAT repeat domain-containing protein [Polyangiaceae bacterium]|nr:HEAT repeat domain-containing protein [Polyangiaceae bacterium]
MLGPPPLPRNLDAAFRDLESARPAVRASAAEDLVRHARTNEEVKARAVRCLIKLLEDPIAGVRSAAAVALGDLGATDAAPSLLRAVDDDDGHVRQMAINALGEIGAPQALARLRRACSDRRPEMRYQAIIAFAHACTDEDDVARALLDATNDNDDAVVHIALRLAEDRLDVAPDTRMTARARALLASHSPHVALVAAIYLGKSGDHAGYALIREVVRTGKINGAQPDKEEECAAVELAGELGLTDLTTDLERRVWGLSRLLRDTCTFHARIALAHMGHPRARAEILRDLSSSRREEREAAVVTAGRARLADARATLSTMTDAAASPELVREALASIDR